MRARYILMATAILVATILAVYGCSSGGGSGKNETPTPVMLQTADAQTVLTDSIPVNGGSMYVDSQGDPIDGLMIEIPENTYSETVDFTVSFSTITGFSGNAYLNPVTPLITIENNNTVANDLVSVKIPLAMDKEHHYMAFYYDRATGRVEGIPEMEHDESSITIATTHFSDIFVNAVLWTELVDDFDSGYRVGQDNWHFSNMKTSLAPNAMCLGMSISSLYYYLERKQKLNEPQLFGRYDSGLPDLVEDDSLALKLASTAQWRFKNARAIEYGKWLKKEDAKNDVWTFFMFVHAMALSGEPQYLGVWDAVGNGHALVVYKKSGNDLYFADPNLPTSSGVKLNLEFNADMNGTFVPYKDYIQYVYFGKTALVEWNYLKSLWQEMDQETIGKAFADYELKLVETDAFGKETERLLSGDSVTVGTDEIKLKIASSDVQIRLQVIPLDESVVYNDQSEEVTVKLSSGEVILGLYVQARTYVSGKDEWQWLWHDFKYVTIKQSSSDDCFIGKWDSISYDYDGDGDGDGDSTAYGAYIEFYADGRWKEVFAQTDGSVEIKEGSWVWYYPPDWILMRFDTPYENYSKLGGIWGGCAKMSVEVRYNSPDLHYSDLGYQSGDLVYER